MRGGIASSYSRIEADSEDMRRFDAYYFHDDTSTEEGAFSDM